MKEPHVIKACTSFRFLVCLEIPSESFRGFQYVVFFFNWQCSHDPTLHKEDIVDLTVSFGIYVGLLICKK